MKEMAHTLFAEIRIRGYLLFNLSTNSDSEFKIISYVTGHIKVWLTIIPSKIVTLSGLVTAIKYLGGGLCVKACVQVWLACGVPLEKLPPNDEMMQWQGPQTPRQLVERETVWKNFKLLFHFLILKFHHNFPFQSFLMGEYLLCRMCS